MTEYHEIKKIHELIKEYAPSTSMGDFGNKELLCTELLDWYKKQVMEKVVEWKGEQIESILRKAFNCMIFRQDHSLSNKEHQYIDLDIVQSIIESFFHIKLDEDGE
jgi:hypothetical protein